MTSYLLRILAVILVSNFVIYLYYFMASWHNVKATGYVWYISIVFLVYALYKWWIYLLSKTPEKVVLKFSHLLWFFLLHLFVLCCFFFSATWWVMQDGVILFFKILYFSIFPLLCLLASYCFWHAVTQKIPKISKKPQIFQSLIALWTGFSLLITTIILFAIFGHYNLWMVFIILGLFLWFWYQWIIQLYKSLFQFTYEFENSSTSPWGFYLFSSEILFYFLTLLISANLISVVRPVPIWWDDLGVYMNYPHLMAQAESLLSLWSMYSWQVFTGLGFMNGVPTQAFFFNSVWGMMSILVIYMIIKDFFAWYKKTFINIPLLIATSYVAMPMITFQLAKDMKLDPGLLFISSIALYLVYKIVPELKKEKSIDISNICYLLIIWVLIGFAFTIKFTTLLLISWVLWVVAYRFFSVPWFIWYLFLYFSFFTKFALWAHLNISYDASNITLVNSFSLITLALWICSFAYAIFQHKIHALKNFWISVVLIIVWMISIMSPWLVKNIIEAKPDISIWTLLSWKPDSFWPDYSLIYTEKELAGIKISWARAIDSEGTTSNEDFWRYFWYESGINNHVKLPFNLTMQKNQWGEFTDITYIYLALIPIIFLFLPYRRKEYIWGIGWLMFVGFLFMYFPPLYFYMTDVLWTIMLPFWYIFILLFFLFWIIFWKTLDTKKEGMRLFDYNLIFTLFYTFLWTISAFGIVWYGIVMYLGFLIMIAISLYYITQYDETCSKKEFQIKLLGSATVFFIFIFYFLMNAFPNSINNIKGSSYATYKNGQITTYESVFDYQTWYLQAIYAMNIAPEKQQEFFDDVIVWERLTTFINQLENKEILFVANVLKKMKTDPQVQDPQLQSDATTSIENIYNAIIEPKPEYKNTKNIYRIGTFLKYYVSENNSRLFDDSLIFNFHDYMLADTKEQTLENIQKLWMDYMLVDLNAATIDKDERRNLTKRYEVLMKHFIAENISLVTTDSICLRVAITEYARSEKKPVDEINFIQSAGVNYESYSEDGERTLRTEKLWMCYEKIISILNSDIDLTQNWYDYLLPIKTYLLSAEWKAIMDDRQKLITFFSQYVPSGRFALFQIQ